METSITHEQWATWMEKLQEPFDPEEVDYRVQRGSMVVAYVDARTVAKRLDDAVGADNWSFDWTPISTSDKGELLVAKGSLTIGGITKSDVGDASNQEGTKGSVSDALKRSAVLWGVARYLYDLPVESVEVANGKPSPAALKKLRAALPKPSGYTEQTPDLPEPTPIRRAAKPEPTVVPVTPTQKDWDRLKIRVKNNGMVTNKEEWAVFMEVTGGSYEDSLAKVEAWEQSDLHKVPALDGGRRNH